MVFAIVERLEREGQSGKIVLREKVNMTNNDEQVNTLFIHIGNDHTCTRKLMARKEQNISSLVRGANPLEMRQNSNMNQYNFGKMNCLNDINECSLKDT